MGKYKLTKNRLFIYICTLYLIALFFGLFFIKTINYQSSTLKPNFIKVFCANYWYIFLMWLFGFSIIGSLFITLIIFFRGFIFGILLKFLITNSLKKLFLILAIEVILFIPSFFTLAYFSLGLSWNLMKNLLTNSNQQINTNRYLNIMIIETIIIVIYSLIIIIN